MDFGFTFPEDFATDESFINYCFQSNEDDVRFWEKWLNEHPDKKKAAEEARTLIFLMSIRSDPGLLEDEYEKIKPKQPEETDLEKAPLTTLPGKKYRKAGMILGILLILIAGVLISWPYWNKKSSYGPKNVSDPAGYATQAAQKRSLTLPDGTHIELNAASKLTVDANFEQAATREVTLVGEAYFDVAKNAAKPFIIHTRVMDIKVLGTTLNVKDYPNDNRVEAALITGSVEVRLHMDSTQKIILKPNEKITVYNKSVSLKPLPAIGNNLQKIKPSGENFRIASLQHDPLLDSGTVSTAWMDGKLVFRNETFDELARQMERKYDVQFHFSDESFKAYRFTGIFSTETVQEALHALQLASPSNPFGYHIEGKEVFITKGN